MINTKVGPLVSVVLSVYNDSLFLKKTINCILNQSYKNLELIIIDDGSNKNTKLILAEFSMSNKKVRIIKNQYNLGLTKSLNIGIKKAKGKYIARHDSDDFSFKLRIEKQVNFLEKNRNIVMCGTQRIIENKIQNRTYRDYLPTKLTDIRKSALYKNPFFHSSVMIRKKILFDVGFYNEKYKYIQDLELWSRIIYKYQCENLPDILCKKYIDNKRISFNKKLLFIRSYYSLKARYRIYLNGHHNLLNFVKMIFIFFGFIKYNET